MKLWIVWEEQHAKNGPTSALKNPYYNQRSYQYGFNRFSDLARKYIDKRLVKEIQIWDKPAEKLLYEWKKSKSIQASQEY
ncbi:MAG: hypothetical protein AAF388_02525 [Bacteroidota bacterium]